MTSKTKRCRRCGEARERGAFPNDQARGALALYLDIAERGGVL